MLFLYFRQNAGSGREELKVEEGGSNLMIVDVFIHCKYQTNECDVGFDHMICIYSLYGSNPERGFQ